MHAIQQVLGGLLTFFLRILIQEVVKQCILFLLDKLYDSLLNFLEILSNNRNKFHKLFAYRELNEIEGMPQESKQVLVLVLTRLLV